MRWLAALVLLILGLLVEAVTVSANVRFLVACLRRKAPGRSSGLPVIGPVLIGLGYRASPLAGHAWIAWAPWCVELVLYTAVFVAARSARANSLTR